MGVDSGLPDFRGAAGFWRAYPMYERLGVDFMRAANPAHFRRDPSFGWGFYGHRLNLYRETVPHPGFELLRRWVDRFRLEHFVVTSNVDGQWQKAGFPEERVMEGHGSIHHLQCLEPCTEQVWANEEQVSVDLQTMRAATIPRCPHCGGVARPNILMFGDFSWIADRTVAQERRYRSCLDEIGEAKMVVIEMGAGTTIPSIRYLSEELGKTATVIRINPRESEIAGERHISLACGALEGLEGIEAALK